jgi:hypothetical protein
MALFHNLQGGGESLRGYHGSLGRDGLGFGVGGGVDVGDVFGLHLICPFGLWPVFRGLSFSAYCRFVKNSLLYSVKIVKFFFSILKFFFF